MKGIPGRIREKNPGLQSFLDYGAAFRARLAGPALGGAAPGPADAQLWGIVALAKVRPPPPARARAARPRPVCATARAWRTSCAPPPPD